MTSRNYDVILTVSNLLAQSFTAGGVIVGDTSNTVGLVAGKDAYAGLLKVKLANTLQEFSTGETVRAISATISGTANGAINNSSALPFYSNVLANTVTTVSANILDIAPSSFIAAKNAFTQNPLVRLYSIYYPGDWYPPNEYGNPSESGEGRAWPADFPIRVAEIVGDVSDDISYNVSYGGTTFMPFPVSLSGVDQSSDGRINELSITLFNVDNIISRIIEDPYLSGNNTSNSTMAHVNGELVHGIDPRTVNISVAQATAIDAEFGSSLARARANGLAYSADVVAEYGKQNCSFTYGQTQAVNGIWEAYKEDSRDMLGGVVEIKTTFANFLDYWPEYSLITAVNDSTITVRNSTPYRVGDYVRSTGSSASASIVSIGLNHDISLSTSIEGATVGNPLYIINSDADSESYLQDRFKIDQLEGLSEHVATFGLVSWLQYFKVTVPKRKYYKNTCQWVYKGAECQYPGPGRLPIPGTNLLSNVNAIGADNTVSTKDVCSKSIAACTLRNNQIHFGGFDGVGRTIPKA